MGMTERIKARLREFSLPITVPARHREYSAVFSADDERGAPSERLLSLALEASRLAREISLKEISARLKAPPYYPDIWPGEHYRLLAALVAVLKPRSVVEIGTATGISALALKKFLPAGGRVTTFDVRPWRDFPGTVLKDEDFADGRLVQVIADLSDGAVAAAHRELLGGAELVFVDAAKDGRMERRFLESFGSAGLAQGAVLVFDDIRLWNMLGIWRDISMPKLDLTSFGHWSGTGLAEWRTGG